MSSLRIVLRNRNCSISGVGLERAGNQEHFRLLVVLLIETSFVHSYQNYQKPASPETTNIFLLNLLLRCCEDTTEEGYYEETF